MLNRKGRLGGRLIIILAAVLALTAESFVFGQNGATTRRHVLPTDESMFYKRTFPDERRETFFNLNQREIVFTLDENPLPFIDWAMVETGHVGWMGERGDVAPLGDPHGYSHRDQILPVPFSLASGVEIRTQKPEREVGMDEFFSTTFPWENGCLPNTLLFDEQTGTYHLWYSTRLGLGYARSTDLKNWEKPRTSSVQYENRDRTNVVYISNLDESDTWMFQHPDKEVIPGRGGNFFIDHSAPPDERFKTTFVASSDPARLQAFAEEKGKPLSPMVSPNSGNSVYGMVSPDGIAWRVLKDPILLHDADTKTVTNFDQELQRYVMYTRMFELGRRTIARSESDDFRNFPLPETVLAPGPENKPYVDYYANSMVVYPNQPTLRLIFGLVYDRSIDDSTVELATSRNGKLWHWVPGPPLLKSGEFGGWDDHFVRTLPSFVPTHDDRMLIVYEGSVMPHKFPRSSFPGHEIQGGGPGVAIWKRDRLAAIEAPERGEFTTCFLKLEGDRILLNMETARAGEILVEAFDENFQRIPGRTFAEADLLNGDGLAIPVTWKGESDMSEYRGKLIFLRFKMRAAKLFAISAAD